MSSRAAILTRLRLQEHAVPDAPAPYRPSSVDLAARFAERARAMLATTDSVANLGAVPEAAARYLTAQCLPLEAAIAAELAHLDWHEAGFAVQATTAKSSTGTAIAFAQAAIAETGSLVLSSGKGPWANLLADTHIAIVRRDAIVPSFEEAIARLFGNRPPRSLHVVSGPSRTGDIEQTLELGAHGAVRLHIIVAPQGETT